MTSPSFQKIGALGLSLLGVWAIMQAISQLAFYLPIILSEEGGYLGWEQLFSPIIFGLLGAGLLVQRFGLSRLLFPEDVEVEVTTSQDIAPFLVALFGAWLAITSIARATQVELQLFNQFTSLSGAEYQGDRFSFHMSSEAWSQRAPYLITLAFGSFLVLRSEGVVTAWLALRKAGRDRS